MNFFARLYIKITHGFTTEIYYFIKNNKIHNKIQRQKYVHMMVKIIDVPIQ